MIRSTDLRNKIISFYSYYTDVYSETNPHVNPLAGFEPTVFAYIEKLKSELTELSNQLVKVTSSSC